MAAEPTTRRLVLRKPSWRKGHHELVAGEDTVLGTLDVAAWSGGAVAEAVDGAWRFERARGLTQKHVRIRDGATDAELADVRRVRFGRGAVLELDGRRYELAARGMFRPVWTWTEGGGELVTLTARGTGRGEKAHIEVTPAGLACPHASLLVLLGCHLVLLAAREQGASAGATSAATAAAS
jgi:hypothetical protein